MDELTQSQIVTTAVSILSLMALGLLVKCRTYLLIKLAPALQKLKKKPRVPITLLQAAIREDLAILRARTGATTAFISKLEDTRLVVTYVDTDIVTVTSTALLTGFPLTLYHEIAAASEATQRTIYKTCDDLVKSSCLRAFMLENDVVCFMAYQLYVVAPKKVSGFVVLLYKQKQLDCLAAGCDIEIMYGPVLKRYATQIESRLKGQ